MLVAVILSAQSTDRRVNLVTPEVFRRWPTPQALAQAEAEDVEEVIKSTGFFRNKTKAIRGARRADIVIANLPAATLKLAPGPNQFSREDGKRLVTVTANVRDRDLGCRRPPRRRGPRAPAVDPPSKDAGRVLRPPPDRRRGRRPG